MDLKFLIYKKTVLNFMIFHFISFDTLSSPMIFHDKPKSIFSNCLEKRAENQTGDLNINY